MKLQSCLIAFALLFTSATAQAIEDENTLATYKLLLATSTDFHGVVPVLGRIEDDKDLRNQDLLDLIAEVVATCAPVDKQEIIARGRSVRVLADSENPRYHSLLVKIANEKTDSGARQAARRALEWKKSRTSNSTSQGDGEFRSAAR